MYSIKRDFPVPVGPFNKKGIWTNGPLHGYVYIIENKNGTYVNQGRLKAGGEIIDVYGY